MIIVDNNNNNLVTKIQKSDKPDFLILIIMNIGFIKVF